MAQLYYQEIGRTDLKTTIQVPSVYNRHTVKMEIDQIKTQRRGKNSFMNIISKVARWLCWNQTK